MIVCDAHPAERATTITLPNGKHLTLCGHHTRTVIEQLITQGKTFNTQQL